jgi:hypothetical protein
MERIGVSNHFMAMVKQRYGVELSYWDIENIKSQIREGTAPKLREHKKKGDVYEVKITDIARQTIRVVFKNGCLITALEV